MTEEKRENKTAVSPAKGATKLKAKNPHSAEPTKPKIVIYGPAGVGKTWFSLNGFPAPYYIDTEGGASRTHYTERLAKAGGVYMGPSDGANDFDTVISQFKALATEKHEYKTVIVDSATKLFNTAIALEAERLGDKDAFGASKKPAIKAMRSLIAAAARLDMNVIFVCHEKAEWGADSTGQRVELGKIADVWEKLIYELDLAFLVQKRGANRFGVVKKSRLAGFPEGDSFPLTYEEFAARYGRDVMEKSATPVVVASAEATAELARLVALLKVPQETVDKWLDKAGVDAIAEFTAEQNRKAVESLTKQLERK